MQGRKILSINLYFWIKLWPKIQQNAKNFGGKQHKKPKFQ
jgi:hypothetical protein